MLGPETIQAAQEAIQQGGSGQAGTLIGLGALAVSSVALWLRIVFVEGRKAKAEAEKASKEDARDQLLAGYPEGSVGAILHDHSKKLTTHDVEIKNICERIAESRRDNKEDHDKLFGKIDTLKDQIFEKIDEVRGRK